MGSVAKLAISLIAVGLVGWASAVMAQDSASLEGIWSTTFTTADDPAWLAEDYFCFFGCTASEYERMGDLLDDPANDERPMPLLSEIAAEYGRQEFVELLTPAAAADYAGRTLQDSLEDICSVYGFFATAVSVMPLRITMEDGRLIFDYETHNAQRVIHMRDSAPPPPEEPVLLGHSVGYFEGGTLVVETTHVGSAPFFVSKAYGLKNSDRLTGVERYSLSDEGRQLDMVLSIEDPEVVTGPWVWVKKWRIAPELELLPHEYDCSFVPGQR